MAFIIIDSAMRNRLDGEWPEFFVNLQKASGGKAPGCTILHLLAHAAVPRVNRVPPNILQHLQELLGRVWQSMRGRRQVVLT